MNIKNLKKEHLAIVVILVLVVAVVYICYFIQLENWMREDFESCIDDKKEYFSSCDGTLARGKIAVMFKDNSTTEEIISIIGSYGLNHSDITDRSLDRHATFFSVPVVLGEVTVARGKEYEWMCRFENNDNVIGTWRGCSNLHFGS